MDLPQLTFFFSFPFSSLIKGASNVIIRNLGISKVLAANGDAIGIRKSGRFPPTRFYGN